MPVTSDHIKELRINLKDTIKKLSKQFNFIIKFSECKKESILAKIYLLNDEIIHSLDHSFGLSIENFSYSPLGKDLRRNISYTMIINSLRKISFHSINIIKYLESNIKYKISNKWSLDLSNKIIKRLKLLDELMTSETPEKAFFLSREDESISLLYRKELKSLNNKIEKTKIKLTANQKEMVTRDFILAIKSFDYVGNEIKEIAKISLFISTGKLK